ncbi:hypothetical protein FACS189441_7090 [Betaproteobacteria bacterium]|nr:hypothetical protein FACS189441_7090 [Betaproteobacteria bacterium]
MDINDFIPIIIIGFFAIDDLIYFLVVLAISYATAPKPVKPKPATLEEFELPTPEEGTAQCVVFGDCWTKDWQVLTYGNLRTAAVKTKSGK